MANTPNPVRKSNINIILAVSGWGLFIGFAIAGAGFYFGYQYRATEQTKTHAAVQDALKAVQAPAAVAQASK